ncbi:MAG: hypothetical protein ACJAZ2_000468 [Glaciecola sp.]|jgi:hypothetical protein
MKKTLLLVAIGCTLNLFSQEVVSASESNQKIKIYGTNEPTIEQQNQRTADIKASAFIRETVN